MNQKNSIEYQKIKHLLNINNDDEFLFIQKINDGNLKKLRIKIAQAIDLEQADIWSRIGKVASFMPNFLNAKVAETVLGPMIAANLSNHVPIKDAVAILKNMSINFLADVATYMIPEKSSTLIDNIPIEILKKVATKLIEQSKHFTASNFVNVLPIQKIITLSEVIYNELDLILISEYVDNKQHIAKIVEGFDDKKILAIIKTAYTHQKQEEILSVFILLPQKQLDRILSLLNSLPASVKEQIVNDFKKRINE